jgi:hypothetical protein
MPKYSSVKGLSNFPDSCKIVNRRIRANRSLMSDIYIYMCVCVCVCVCVCICV